MNRALQPVRYVWEYLKEISGENAYDRYLAIHG
nr:putative selenoprotein [Rubrobacter sp.]